MDDRERLKIVIMQMIEHNKIHLEKYEKWAGFAKAHQLVDAGIFLDDAGKLSVNVNIALEQTLNYLLLQNHANTEKG